LQVNTKQNENNTGLSRKYKNMTKKAKIVWVKYTTFALINQRRAPLFVNSKLKLRKFLTGFYPT
ncbi:MAG: hypothetical protein SOU48_08295, partial [Prevotella sp.]|nr:hypothetical protein [Prevotella sp.]MDY2806472.1 hypothetical protein [Prevotella sp.]